MASPNSNFPGDLLAVTVQELEDELFDNILTKNATTAALKEYGAVEPKDGGPTVAVPVMYAVNESYKRYSGAEQLNTSSNEVFAVFQYVWYQIALNIQANGREILQNMGRSQNRDLVKSRVMNAKATYENQFNIDILSDGSLTNQIVGLQGLISDNGTGTVGNVSRTTYPFAKNQFYRATTDGGAAMNKVNIVDYMDSLDLLIQAQRGKTKVILADDYTFKYYEGNVAALQRLTPTGNGNNTLAKLGFNTYAYKQAEVVFEPSASGMPTYTQYWIDPEVLSLMPHSSRNLARLPKRDSFNQDAQIEYLATMVAFGAKNYKRLGVLNND